MVVMIQVIHIVCLESSHIGCDDNKVAVKMLRCLSLPWRANMSGPGAGLLSVCGLDSIR